MNNSTSQLTTRAASNGNTLKKSRVRRREQHLLEALIAIHGMTTASTSSLDALRNIRAAADKACRAHSEACGRYGQGVTRS